MRKLLALAIAIMVTSALAEMSYAAPRGGGGRGGAGGGAFGPGPGNNQNKQDLSTIDGVIKTVNATGEGVVVSIVVAANKNKDGSDGPVVTMVIIPTTQVFNGEEPAKSSNLAVGKSVSAAYSKTPDGGFSFAVLIRIVKTPEPSKKETAKDAPKGSAKDAPKDAPKDDPKDTPKPAPDDSGVTTIK